MDVRKLADEIINGRRLTKEDDLSFFLFVDLRDLTNGADRIRTALCGKKVDLCTIISGRSGKCSENCRFCAQSAHHHTSCEVHGLLPEEVIMKEAAAMDAEGVDRVSIVNSGKGPTDEEFEELIRIFGRMGRELKAELCCSIGFLTEEQFQRLHDAGIRNVHCNIETSRRFFPEICTTHTFDDKIANIRRAQAASLTVCSGGIIGMGETFSDRVDMALTLAELQIPSIPINSLMPIPGTPLEHRARLTEEEILRTVAMFRYLNPEAQIRLAGGRALMRDNGKACFSSGANASITGNMLTTSGSTIAEDRGMLEELGLEVKPL